MVVPFSKIPVFYQKSVRGTRIAPLSVEFYGYHLRLLQWSRDKDRAGNMDLPQVHIVLRENMLFEFRQRRGELTSKCGFIFMGTRSVIFARNSAVES